jgi:hypothetical protein
MVGGRAARGAEADVHAGSIDITASAAAKAKGRCLEITSGR